MVLQGNPRHVHQNAEFNNGIKISVAEGRFIAMCCRPTIANGQKDPGAHRAWLQRVRNAVVSGQVDASLVDAVTRTVCPEAEPQSKVRDRAGFQSVRG